MMTYGELLKRADAPPGSSWGLFGRQDEIGTLNFLTPDCALRAAGRVRRGAVFNLDHRLDAFDPPIARSRRNPRHVMFSNNPHHNDDYLEELFLQVSTQIDGLRHFRHPVYGYYNGVNAERIKTDSPTLGVNRYAERGIVGRGVLIDVERHLKAVGRCLDYAAGEPFPASLLDEVAAAECIAFEPGDILLLRTGWLAWYFNTASPAERQALPGHLRSPGLVQSHDSLAWLWDNKIALAASDNAAVEAVPPIANSPFKLPPDFVGNPIHSGMMHPSLIALLGLALGELWDLESLAADCAADRIYECMVTAKPLNLTGGVGSPANALAIK